MLKITRRLAVLFAVVLPLAACGSGTSDSGSSGSETIRVVVPSAPPLITGTIALGIASGTFKNAGVDVELQIGDGAQATNAMVAGRADLTEAGVTQASSVEVQGKDISAVWANSGGGLGLALYTATGGPVTLSDFQSKLAGKCVFGVTTLSGTDFGYATLFNTKAHIDCKIVELGDSSQVLGALVSGRVNIMIGTGTSPDMLTAIKAGKIQTILKTGDPEFKALGLPQFPERVLYGLADNLNKKRIAMEKFIVGMRQAAQLYASTDAEQIADKMLTVGVIKEKYPFSNDREGLIDSIKSSKPFINWTDGYISSADWETMLATVANWGIKGFDPKDPKRSYASIVDMFFYDESKKK